MKKRLSFLQTIVIGLAMFFVLGAIAVWLSGKFESLDWIPSLVSMVSFLLFFEIAGRFGPKEMDTPISKFLELSIRDRVVTVIAILAYIVLAFPIGRRFDSVWLSFVFAILGLFALWLICFVFGSDELKRAVLLKNRHKSDQQG